MLNETFSVIFKHCVLCSNTSCYSKRIVLSMMVFVFSWGCQVSCLSPKYTHESWLSLGADHVLDIEDLRPTGSSALPKAPVGSSKLQFDLVINTGGPLMQDTCNEVATKRVITTLTSAVPTQMKMEYNVIYNCVSRY